MKIMTGIVAIFLLLTNIGFTSIAGAESIHKTIPASIDPDKKFYFFLHGKIVEKKGIPARSKKYGDYEYTEILEEIASEGFEVISEVRNANTDILEYSNKVAEDIEKLLAAGVPGENITVTGFSKGGRMTLVIASLLENKDINFVVLAGCRASDIDDYDLKPVGRILSIYDTSDDKFGSCAKIFSSDNEDLETKELVLEIGDGHGVFYKPLEVWMQPAINWSRP